MKPLVCLLLLCLSLSSAYAEEEMAEESGWFENIDLNPFDMKGWTPRYAYVDGDNFIGYTHYVGLSYFQKAGKESEGVTFRTGLGNRGKKYNLAYTNSFPFMHVDFGLSYYDLDDDNFRNLSDEELLGIEMGLRFWVVQIIGVHTENTSFVKLAYGF